MGLPQTILLQALNRTDKTPLLFGTFAATFTYALLALSEVHGDDMPSVAVTVALILMLVCTAIFLRLLVTFRNAQYPAPFGSAECDRRPRGPCARWCTSARRAFPGEADEAEAVRPDRQGIGSPRR